MLARFWTIVFAIAAPLMIAGEASAQMVCGRALPVGATIHDIVGPSYRAVDARVNRDRRQDGADADFVIAYDAYRKLERFAQREAAASARVIEAFRIAMNTARSAGNGEEADPDKPDLFTTISKQEAQAIDGMIRRIQARTAAIKVEMERQSGRVFDLHEIACIAEKNRPTDPDARKSVVTIVAATYGENCANFKPPPGRTNSVWHGNATNKVEAKCRGQRSCTFVIRWQELTDPAYGCMKNFKVEYKCADGPTKSAIANPEAGHGSAVHMSCE